FFFFGLLWLKVQDILPDLSPLSSSQALSHQYLPVKRRITLKSLLISTIWPNSIECRASISKPNPCTCVLLPFVNNSWDHCTLIQQPVSTIWHCCMRAMRKYEQAGPLYLRALAIYEQQLGPLHPHTATSLNNLATHYQTQSQFEQAKPL